jgi:hypothetical protein
MQEPVNQKVNKYLEHFSSELCQEIKDFATNEVLKDSRYIFVNTVDKKQYGYCTHCNNKFKTHLPKPSDKMLQTLQEACCNPMYFMGEEYEKKEQGKKITCPVCNSLCLVKYANRGHKHLRDTAHFVYYEKSILDSNILTARAIYAVRDYGDSYKNVETTYSVDAHYVFQYKKGGRMIKDCYSWGKGSWLSFAKTVHSIIFKHGYKTKTAYSRESIRKAVENTPFAWSCWDQFDFEDMVTYFDFYSRSPVIEYLAKLGHKNIVIDKLKGIPTYSSINWKGKDLYSVFKLSKEEYNSIKQLKIPITFWFLKVLRLNKEKFYGLSLLEVKELSETMYGEEGSIESISRLCVLDKSFRDAFRYILKQYNKHRNTYYSLHTVIRDWIDYKSDCKKLGLDIKDVNILFPSDLHKAHQNTTAQIKYAEDMALTEKIRARSAELKDYCFEHNELFLRPAESAFELVEEGKSLNHCVGQYAERHAKGETNIFFIRKITEPNISFFTMELKNNSIVQVRGKRNVNYTEDASVKAFVEEFTKQKLTKKKQKSRVSVPA